MKAKFYPLRTLLFTLLLSFGFAEAINAQTIYLDVRDRTTGGDGSQTYVGDRLRYTITVTGPLTTNDDPKIAMPIPAGTSYAPGSTTLDGIAQPDQSGNMPWATAQSIPALAQSTDQHTLRFEVTVNANSGTITGSAELQTVNVPSTSSNQTLTNLVTGYNCLNQMYALTTQYTGAVFPPNPSMYLPYRYIRELDITTGNTGLVYDGSTGACKDAITQVDLQAGSVLTDATATASENGSFRIYFVNKPTNGVPSDLCYVFIYPGSTPVAYRFFNTPLTQNTTSLITRMTMDAAGNGYAITDDGSEFIHFTAGLSNNVIVDPRGPLINDPNNGSNNVLNETDGDIVCDGTGNLLLIAKSKNIYRINVSNNISTYLGTIIDILPSTGISSAAIDKDGFIYVGGKFTSVYKLTLSTLRLSRLSSANSFASQDFSGCAVPIQPARVAVNETTTTPLNKEVSARVLPNPFRKQLNLQVQLTTAENVKVRLVDFYGRTVYTTTKQMGAGINSLNVAVPGNLSSGIYVVDIWAGNTHLLQKKLVKQ